MKNLETEANLTEYEIQVLITIMSERHQSGVHRSAISHHMAGANFTPLATSIAMASLLQKQMIDASTYKDENHNEYEGWDLTAEGIAWIMANQKDLPLKFSDNQTDNSPF